MTLRPIVDYLADKGYTEWRKEGLLVEGWPVQFLPVSDDLDKEAIGQALLIEETFEGRRVSTRVLSPEHLIAIALRTGRPKDNMRIIAFVESGVFDAERLRAILERHGLSVKWKQLCRRAGLSDRLDPTSGP